MTSSRDPLKPDEALHPIELDARRLRGLAHPMRVRILHLLETDGAATATMLADRLQVRSGSTSWHLAKLAEHGLVEEIPDRGAPRERWWQPARSGWMIRHGEFADDAELADASEIVLSSVLADQLLDATRFLHEDWDAAWRRSWILTTDQSLELDPAGLEALRADLWAVLERYRSTPSISEGAERITFQMQGFPRRHQS